MVENDGKRIMLKEGATVGQLIDWLNKITNKNTKVKVASDEEQNTLFNGYYIDVFRDEVIIAGLSGCEEEETWDEEDFEGVEE